MLDSGEKLILLFYNLLNNLRLHYGKVVQHFQEPDVSTLELFIRSELEQFDQAWANF